MSLRLLYCSKFPAAEKQHTLLCRAVLKVPPKRLPRLGLYAGLAAPGASPVSVLRGQCMALLGRLVPRSSPVKASPAAPRAGGTPLPSLTLLLPLLPALPPAAPPLSRARYCALENSSSSSPKARSPEPAACRQAEPLRALAIRTSAVTGPSPGLSAPAPSPSPSSFRFRTGDDDAIRRRQKPSPRARPPGGNSKAPSRSPPPPPL